MITRSYQTIPLPTGRKVKGLFPTNMWFQQMTTHVNFSGKSVLDLGCNHFSYGIQCLCSGASRVTGVEVSKEACDGANQLLRESNFIHVASVFNQPIELYIPTGQHDIVIMSMVIHHLDDAAYHLQRFYLNMKENLIIIYRYPNPDIAEHGFRPTIDELDETIGIKHMVFVALSDTFEQNIRMAIYAKTVG